MLCDNFSIKGQDTNYPNNKINIQISGVGTTEVGEPLEVLKEENIALTIEDIADFVKKGQEWWNLHIH